MAEALPEIYIEVKPEEDRAGTQGFRLPGDKACLAARLGSGAGDLLNEHRDLLREAVRITGLPVITDEVLQGAGLERIIVALPQQVAALTRGRFIGTFGRPERGIATVSLRRWPDGNGAAGNLLLPNGQFVNAKPEVIPASRPADVFALDSREKGRRIVPIPANCFVLSERAPRTWRS